MFLVLGYGNPLRQDDGFGWRAVERLRSLELPKGVEIRALHQLTPEISEDIAAADGVIFLDARADGVPGEIRESAVEAGVESSFLAHSVNPPMLLALSQHLYGRSPHAILLTVTGSAFGLGESLSDAVEGAVDESLARVQDILAAWSATLSLSKGDGE